MNERILLNTLAKVLEVEPEVVYNMEYDVKFENAPFLLNDELDIYLDENGDEY